MDTDVLGSPGVLVDVCTHTLQVFYHLYGSIRGRCRADWYRKKRLSHLRKILAGQVKQSCLTVPQDPFVSPAIQRVGGRRGVTKVT